MTHYFIDFGYSTATKNKPQHEAHAFLSSLHGVLILQENLQNFQNFIIEKIKEIFSQYPRCKPLVIEFDPRGYRSGQTETKAIWMKGFEAVAFKFEPAVLIHDPLKLKEYAAS